MATEKLLPLRYVDWIFNKEWNYQYWKTTFELKESLNTAFGKPSLEIVSTVEYDADSLNDCAFIDMQDMRFGETYCIETALIKGFRQVPFDAKAYNEMIEQEKAE